MDSWIKTLIEGAHTKVGIDVSTLILMDSWIKTNVKAKELNETLSFNPCFNGFMDKDGLWRLVKKARCGVSTLVLMDSWIKTLLSVSARFSSTEFQPLF